MKKILIISLFLIGSLFAASTQVIQGNLSIKGTTTSTGALTAPTLNTGYGANELYAMNQNVRTTDSPTFANITSTGTVRTSFIEISTMTTTPTTHKEGRMYWDSTDHTLAIQSGISDTTLQVGQEQFMRVRNITGVTIPDGAAVYITGRVGNRPTVELAIATSSITARVAGVATEDIDTASDGFITTSGFVRGLNTSAYTANAPLYLSTSTAGAYSTTCPALPNYCIEIGRVAVVGNVGIGSIDVKLGIEPTNHVVINHLGVVSDATVLGGVSGKNLTATYGVSAATGTFKQINAVDATGLKLYDDSNNGIFIRDGGYVGIGTTTPTVPLEINSTPSIGGQALVIYGDQNKERLHVRSYGRDSVVGVFSASGTLAAPTPITTSKDLGYFQIGGWDGVVWQRSAWIRGIATEDWSASAHGTDLVFATSPNGGGVTEYMRIKDNGNVGIGTTIPTTKLQINGTVGVVPSATQVLYSTSTITSTSSFAVITSSGGAVVLTSNPQITAGVNGQELKIRGNSDTDTVEIIDGSGVSLDANTNFPLGRGDWLYLVYSTDTNTWEEITRSTT